MPELPEVETIRRRLQDGYGGKPGLVGRQIQRAELLWARTLAEPDPDEFHYRIQGQRILDFDRRAKYLSIRLSDDVLVLHLRMSGDLWVEAATDEIAPHHRLVLYLEGDMRLAFNDPRKFGRAWLLADPAGLFTGLGPEPLSEDFEPQRFYHSLQQRRRRLKPLLLDQHFIAGLGNIYTDEALHLAGLHPMTMANCLNYVQAERLWQSIRRVLQEGIRRNGASIDWVYRGGDFQNYFQVYQRVDQPCYRCGTAIVRTVVGQRGTHFCPQCQPVEPGD
ncbi:MAG: bifunctional DNA-formamidopyrimidine glycosylase/DNA-(apurinic or apyrimidinic site) lyase [Anaerolineales bacterium]|nr:bifunctional DNA-formamidopyrimidine glycosylase/DNA-(apurinic or apyrimidinic site) lyase [Anaerolineales bacterium]